VDPEKFDKVVFNRFAKDLINTAEALYKADNSAVLYIGLGLSLS
jgi:hypothetical protein